MWSCPQRPGTSKSKLIILCIDSSHCTLTWIYYWTHLSYSQDGLCRPLDKPHCGGHPECLEAGMCLDRCNLIRTSADPQRCLEQGECHCSEINVTWNIKVTFFPVYESLVASLRARTQEASDWAELILWPNTGLWLALTNHKKGCSRGGPQGHWQVPDDWPGALSACHLSLSSGHLISSSTRPAHWGSRGHRSSRVLKPVFCNVAIYFDLFCTIKTIINE